MFLGLLLSRVGLIGDTIASTGRKLKWFPPIFPNGRAAVNVGMARGPR
jgi:hypothetical protein